MKDGRAQDIALANFHDTEVRNTYDKFLFRLLHEARELGHGGCYIVCPETSSERIQAEPFLRMKYPCEFNLCWSLLLESCRDVPGLDNQALDDASDLIAHLTTVDGAVVMTDQFRVLGFGAEVLLPQTAVHLKKVILNRGAGPDLAKDFLTTDIDLEAQGTRHRSAYRLASQIPELTIFVISQDGDISGVVNEGGNVIVWPLSRVV